MLQLVGRDKRGSSDHLNCEVIISDKYQVPISWPQNGEIVFDNVTLHHKMMSAGNGPVLVDINVTIPAGQKVSKRIYKIIDHHLSNFNHNPFRSAFADERAVASHPSFRRYLVPWT